MAQASVSQYVKLLLLGKTGAGKSATGNSILGWKVFETYGGAASVTEKIKSEFFETDGHIVHVIDGPGLEDTKLDDVKDKTKLVTSVRNALVECSGSINALVLVIKYGDRFTQESQNAVKAVMTIIGNDAMAECGIVVMTNANGWTMEHSKQDFQAWCEKVNADYGGIFERCKYRCVLFENATDDATKKKEQREKLLSHVSISQSYTNKNFKAAEAEHKKYIAGKKCLLLKDEYQAETSLLIGNIAEIDPTLPIAKKKKKFTDVKQRAERLLKKAQRDDAGSGGLASLQEQLKTTIKNAESGNAQALKEAAYRLQHLKDARKSAAWKIAGYSFLTLFTFGGAIPRLIDAVEELASCDIEIEKNTV